ncbi:MAG TPA: ABC transporter ATP-binding protein [Nocardioides sp.]
MPVLNKTGGRVDDATTAPSSPVGATEALLEVENMGKQFGKSWAVHESTFEVRRGEFFGLLGPSGCGKSTTLNIVAGFLDPTVGDVRINRNSVVGVPPHRRDTAMVFQDYALFPHLSAADNIGFGLKLRRRGKRQIDERVAELLELVSLSGKGAHLPSQLSGGEQQRVAVARALAVEPEVILLDEPLSNLDARLRDHMRTELKRILRASSSTVVFVTHDQGEAFSMCDRVAVMFDGRIQQLDVPSQIYGSPATVPIAQFIGEANLFRCTVVASDADALRLALDDQPGRPVVAALPDIGAAVGEAGRILVRPECLRIDSDLRGGGDLRAEVIAETYLGPVVQYHLGAGDVSMSAWRFSHEGLFSVGESVRVTWRPEDARYYAGAGE